MRLGDGMVSLSVIVFFDSQGQLIIPSFGVRNPRPGVKNTLRIQWLTLAANFFVCIFHSFEAGIANANSSFK